MGIFKSIVATQISAANRAENTVFLTLSMFFTSIHQILRGPWSDKEATTRFFVLLGMTGGVAANKSRNDSRVAFEKTSPREPYLFHLSVKSITLIGLFQVEKCLKIKASGSII